MNNNSYFLEDKNLYRLLRTDPALELLDSDSELKMTNWTEGACYPLALALKEIVGGNLKLIVNDKGDAQHVLLEVSDDKYIDGDGVSTGYEKLKRITDTEFIDNPKIINFDLQKVIDSNLGMGGTGFVQKLVEFLKSNIPENKNNAMQPDIEETELPPVISASWFIDDNFFKAHPEKVLGEPYEASGRFGKVTKYKGDITAVDRIDVQMDFVGVNRSLADPLISTGNDVNISAKLTNPAIADFVKGVIQKADQQSGERINRKTKKKIEEEAVLTESPQLQTFEDVWRTYNPGISKTELEIFIWYKTRSGRPLSRQWVNLLYPGRYREHLTRPVNYAVEQDVFNSWVEAGLVYYFSGEFIPAPQYFSGNMYEKKMQLTRDREDIVSKFGQGVYDRQEANFNLSWKTIYDKRLVISSTNKSLIILPISKLSNSFMVSRIAEMPEDTPFKIKKITAASAKNYGKPDWAGDLAMSEYDRKREEFEELSLTDAFIYWLLRYKPDLTQAVTHYDIAKYYCLGSPIRIEAKDDSPASKKEAIAKKEKLKSSTQQEGERLFKIFLANQIEANDKVRLETQWNADYNNFLPIDFNKIPVAFNMCRYYKGSYEELKPEKREAVAFMLNNGSGVLAYDVGVGKTPSSIFATSVFLDAGYCKRPLLCVPNQVYKQFISEIKNFAPHLPIMEGYNLSESYLQNFRDVNGKIVPVPEGVITIITYEGLERIGFNDDTQSELLSSLYDILNQGGESEREKSEKQIASFMQKLETLVGKGIAGTLVNIEDFGFDYITYDEAHKMKKVFTAVKGETTTDEKGKTQRGKNPYVINSGVPSSIALKGFMLNYYVQKQNKGQNIMLLSATPFTNSPLEIFSMLTMVGYEQLQSTDLNNIKNFFDTYIKTSTELVINSRLKPQFKQVIKGFNNLISLQALIRRFILYKTGEDVNVQRPAKFVLPYLKKVDNGIVTVLGEDEKVETYIQMTAKQEGWMEDIINYVETGNEPSGGSAAGDDEGEVDEDQLVDNEAVEIDENFLSEKEKQGVRSIKGLNWARNLALSPHLYAHSGLPKPTYKTYIGMSPKLQYVMDCVSSVKHYHESKDQPLSGQIIYMDRGIEYFGLIKEYLVKVVGYKEHEIGIIKSGMPKNGRNSKEHIKNLFNGEVFNENTQLYEPVTDEERIKIIIGSSTIREGINLQKYTTVIYNCFVDWNPTDQNQLEGRGWRQGNTFLSIRVVIPLVVNSADIFMFQKLEEKTARINTIWSTDGKDNVLDTEELNHEELKYALIRDIRVIAELKSIEYKSKIESDMINFNRQKEIIERIKQSVREVNDRFGDVKEEAEKYRTFKPTNNKLADAVTLVKLINDVSKTQKDKEGLRMVNSWERNDWQRSEKKGQKEIYSDLNPYHKPYWFSDFAIAVRDLVRTESDFIKQNEIEFSLQNLKGLDSFLAKVDGDIKAAEEKKTYYDSAEFKKQIETEVIEKREKDKIGFKTIQENVIAFSRLNYLLSDRKVKISLHTKYKSCPPMDSDGVRLVDSEALSFMDTCVANAGQTKDTYFDKDAGAYNPARQKLHNKIINDLFEGVKCIKKGAPIAVFTGGAPASGKSTYLKKVASYLLSPDIFHLDADKISSMLPEYEGWNANTTHRETQDIVNEILDNIGSASCGYDFVYDGTMNRAQKYYTLVNKVKSMGYKTYVIFMDIPYGVARKRALDRYKKSGRYVPMDVIDDFFKVIPDHNGLTMGQYALNQLKDVVDGYVVVDSITGDIIEKGGEPMPEERHYATSKPKLIEKQTIIEPIEKEVTTISKSELSHEDQGQLILDTIAGLQFLADDGDQDAINTIEGLKLLI